MHGSVGGVESPSYDDGISADISSNLCPLGFLKSLFFMHWVEFGRNWRDPAPAAGIVVKLWKGRACQWLLLLSLL
jgi:hypothetical protein